MKSRKLRYQQRQQRIINLFKKYPYDWSKISQILKIKQQSYGAQIYRNYYKFNKYDFNKKWTKQEDILLKQLAQKHNYQWQLIAPHFQNCTIKDCYLRCRNLIKKKSWTEQQVLKLRQLFKKYPFNWKKMSSKLGEKNSSDIQNKYESLWKDEIIKQQCEVIKIWSQQQLIFLEQLSIKYQYDWNKISKYFQGCRTIQCYFKYKTIFQSKNLQSQPSQFPQNNTIPKQLSSEQQQSIQQCPIVYMNNLFQAHPYNWQQIANRLPNCIPQTAEHMYKVFNGLTEEIKKIRWYKFEDDKLQWLSERLGYKWNEFGDYFEECSGYDCFLRLRILRQRKGNECIGNEVEEWDINKVGSKKNEQNEKKRKDIFNQYIQNTLISLQQMIKISLNTFYNA